MPNSPNSCCDVSWIQRKERIKVMTINKTKNGNEVMIRIEGRVDSKTAPEFESSVKEEFGSSDSMVIDLANVNYISSAGLRVFLTAHKSMASKGGLKVINVCKEVMAIFDVTGFSGVLDIES